ALERDVDDALARSERLVERQRELADDVERAGASPDTESLRRLRERKDELAREVEALEEALDRLARESRREQPEASRALGGAARSIRDSRLRDKILYSRGVIGGRSPEYARNFEEEITRNAEELRDRVAEARDAFRESDPRRLERQLDEARDLVRGLESLQERIRQRAERGESGGGEPPGRDEGEQSEGRQGQSEGRQGQGEGRQGQGQQGPGRGEGRSGQGQGGDGRGESPPGRGQAGGAGGGFAPGGSGLGGLSPDEIRQFQREFRERRDDAQRLRDELREQGIDIGGLSGVIESLRRLEEGTFDDPEELRRLQDAVLSGLKDFEFGLRRGLGAEIERLFLSGSDEVPPEYRALVEEYYRALSEGGPPR
ncbi:MAG: hypothetical protein ACRELC_12625, partial [Gemmatimonadota bacterium]